jgi:hypothetical protein
LPIAQSIVALTEVVILSIIMIKRDPKLFDRTFVGAVIKMVSISGFSAIATILAINFLPLVQSDTGFVLTFKLAVISAITFGVYVGLSYLYGMSESKFVLSKLKTMALKAIKV